MTVAGLVLAAGASRRYGAPKALARLHGSSFLEHTLAALSPTEPRIVVVGAPHASAIERELGERALAVRNPEPGRGMLSSLQIAFRALPSTACAVVVALIDHPRVRAETVALLIGAWRGSGAALIRPRFAARSGHPFLIDGALFEPIARAKPSDHLGRVLGGLGTWLELDVADRGVLDDFDTPGQTAHAS